MSLSVGQTNMMVSLFRQGRELCQVKPGETVTVLSEAEQAAEYASAFMIATRGLGVDVRNVNLPRVAPGGAQNVAGEVSQNAVAGNRPAIEILKSADLVVDLIFLLFPKEQLEIQAADIRILLMVDPREVLLRLFPTQALRDRVEAAEVFWAKAKNLRFTDPAGTDVQYELEQFPTLTEYGFTDAPGRWDHWPGGFLATQDSETGVNGTAVMDRGGILFPFKKSAQEPITFTIRDPMIVDIDGSFDAMLVKNCMGGLHDPRTYALSHIGWGLNDRACWDYLATSIPAVGMDGRAFYGNVLFSIGLNTELGGSNDTACPTDLPMTGCTLYLDGELIVQQDGDVAPTEMRAVTDKEETVACGP